MVNSNRLHWLGLALLLLALAALAAGCQSAGAPVPVTRRPAPLQAEITPAPLPTGQPLPESGSVSLSPWPLHGRPPYTAAFQATITLDRGCRLLRWQFGDGRAQEQPCPAAGFPRQAQTTHRYSVPDTYHVRLLLETDDGRHIESTTQTVVVAVPQPRSWREPLLYWGVWAAAVATAVVAGRWLWRRPSASRRLPALALLAFILVTWLPPFSYLPNPIGLAWALVGGYTYDPRLPFANRFVVAGDPTTHLRPFLDGLIGQTGLEPLDPVKPLVSYDFVRVRTEVHMVYVTTRFHYAGGRMGRFEVPLYQPGGRLYQAGWRYDGLGRLRTEFRALPAISPAGPDAPLRLGPPQPMALPPQTPPLDTMGWFDWPGGSAAVPVWSPGGDAFLALGQGEPLSWLWLVPLDGRPPLALAENVGAAGWTADGLAVLFTPAQVPFTGPEPEIPLYHVGADGQGLRQVALLSTFTLPGVTAEGVWLEARGAAWLVRPEGGAAQRLADLPDANPAAAAEPMHPAPDGRRFAYTCGQALCLADRDGQALVRIAIAFQALQAAWSADSSRLAAVHWESGGGPPKPILSLIGRDGRLLWQLPLAEGEAGRPQWTPEGDWLWLSSFAYQGRRILAVETATGRALDLSRPRWDAWFALSPDGGRLLLRNGRGGFWIAPLLDQPVAYSD